MSSDSPKTSHAVDPDAKKKAKKAKKPGAKGVKANDEKAKKKAKAVKAKPSANGHKAPNKTRGDGPTHNDVIIARLKKGSFQKPVSREALKEALRKAFPHYQEFYVAKYVSDALSWFIPRRKSLGMTVMEVEGKGFYLKPKKGK